MNPPAQTPIYVIGSINTDMIVKADKLPSPGETVMGGDFLMTAGGKGGNQAVAVARHGARVAMVANLGTDIFGDQAISRLQTEGIDCANVGRDADQPSGVALISVDASGENHIVVAPGANDTLTEKQVEEALESMPAASIVLLQLEIPLAAVARGISLAQAKGCRVILDPAPARALPKEMLGGLYLLTPNETEAEILTGLAVDDPGSATQAATQLLAVGVRNVAITLGAQGVLLANDQGSELIGTPAVTALDTTAAGDCFNGSLAVALGRGDDLRDAMAFACKAAAISVTRMGAQDSMPYSHEIDA
ncbi:MAG TPA: ribokinase [Gemmatimonadetes bacterium]|nr:ribokinase [Gemmatimonadota bacterium]